MTTKKKSAPLVEQRNAPTPKGVKSRRDDTSIVRHFWRVVKWLSCMMGSVCMALAALMFIGAPVEGDMSWSAGFALTIAACTAAWLLYELAGEEIKEVNKVEPRH